VTDFNGSTLPSEWDAYQGQPGGDPGGQFDTGHVVVGGGMLQINTYQDPAFNNDWVTGGLCLCGLASQTYGAYFVRSRVTGGGATAVELLWPNGNVWPPEIDFNESYGSTSGTSATVHFNSSNSTIGRSVNVNLTQWHTWGVIWTPNSITYTVDGNVWGKVSTASAIPNIPMHISLQSQTFCASGWACPTAPSSLQVDWVAQYATS
jgi:beta-glucanase (GH16 family)